MKKVYIGIATLSMFALPMVAAAQVNIDEELGTTFGLGSADLESTVINIIQWILGFLGLIAVIFILYGGFMWMTAAGNEDRVSTAKKIITSAVIGLIVVLLAWAIVIFVVNQTGDVTGA
ncbi:MAG: hypothetical protein PHY34_04190 [Patescibacteria group bacterium]|nr:hypothetical protein [Patescibacteria group bacterium]MDD5715345.1 hypothetical protein [Patescibacteria group bacterium]